MRKKVIAANWKMNKTNKEALETLTELKNLTGDIENVTIVVGAPFTALSDAVKTVKDSNISIAAQNIYPKDEGAYTGEISPVMLKYIGVNYVIVGHSERREYFKETNEFINEKIMATLSHDMIPIFCIGEKLEDREQKRTNEVIKEQLIIGLNNLSIEDAKKLIIAYEPVWAIGTGKSASPQMAQETHKEIRNILAEIFTEEVAKIIPIQYGGSINVENAKTLLSEPDIDGGLIGGASLRAESFYKIIKAGE